MTDLVQIVPTLPPVVDGLGDYAVLLDRALTARGLSTRFLVTSPGWSRDGNSPAADLLPEPTPNGLVQALGDRQQVLLHFVNYAYEPTRGCPWWMLEGLKRWRHAGIGRRLVVMFHELFAMGWPWRKAFWYSAPQRAISAELARMADACWTSNQRYAAWLEDVLGRPVATSPVLSNIGEPLEPRAWAAREPAMVVFGRAVNRRRAYREMHNDLLALARTHAITVVHDVGAPLGSPLTLPGMTVVEHGLLPVATLSPLVERCRVGVIHNEGSPLAKSGVVAAYAAHGVAICCEAAQVGGDGLVPGYNLITANDVSVDPSGIACHGRRWYDQHASGRLGDLVAPWFARPDLHN